MATTSNVQSFFSKLPNRLVLQQHIGNILVSEVTTLVLEYFAWLLEISLF